MHNCLMYILTLFILEDLYEATMGTYKPLSLSTSGDRHVHKRIRTDFGMIIIDFVANLKHTS